MSCRSDPPEHVLDNALYAPYNGFKDVLVYFHQVFSSQTLAKTDNHRRLYWCFMAEFLHSKKVLQVWVFLNLFYDTPVRKFLAFLNNQNTKSHSKRSRRMTCFGGEHCHIFCFHSAPWNGRIYISFGSPKCKAFFRNVNLHLYLL